MSENFVVFNQSTSLPNGAIVNDTALYFSSQEPYPTIRIDSTPTIDGDILWDKAKKTWVSYNGSVWSTLPYDGYLINGVAHFVRNTTPTVRVDGSALVVGDRWYNPSTGYQWFWNGTYWLGDPAISANTDVAANTAARHAAVTVTDSSEIDFTLTGQNITASLINGSIGATRLSSGVNTSLGLANTALQPSTIGVTVQGYSAILAGTTASFTTADKSKIDGIQAGAQVNNISNVNATDLTDGGETTLHIHDGRYYTESETNALINNAFANPTFTGLLTTPTLRLNGTAVIVNSSAPTVRSDGSALVAGDLWWNPSTGIWGFWKSPYWLTVQTFGPRGSYTFVGSPEGFVTINDGVGLTYGAFIEKLVIRYKTRTTAHNVSNYRNLSFTFRGARNQIDEINVDKLIPLNNPYPTTTYVTVEEVINTYAGARGDVNINTATSTTIAGSPDALDCSFWLVIRGVLA